MQLRKVFLLWGWKIKTKEPFVIAPKSMSSKNSHPSPAWSSYAGRSIRIPSLAVQPASRPRRLESSPRASTSSATGIFGRVSSFPPRMFFQFTVYSDSSSRSTFKNWRIAPACSTITKRIFLLRMSLLSRSDNWSLQSISIKSIINLFPSIVRRWRWGRRCWRRVVLRWWWRWVRKWRRSRRWWVVVELI